jgi:tetratricopeptide (TPR) repeat protein
MERHLMDMDSTGMLGCPAPEDLAAFADGRLTRAQRAHIELHLADCGTCREVVADTVLLSNKSLGSFWAQPRKRMLAGGGAVLALAASLVVAARVQPDLLPFDRDGDYAQLVAAVGQNRTVEGRVTGGFSYAPMKPATRGARDSGAEDFALLAARSELEARAQAEPTAANRHAAGVAQLVAGDHEAAVTTLEAVVATASTGAAYYSDLSAAYLARGREWDRREDFEKARTAAERAIVLDPLLDEPYFNRALALDALGHAREAEAAYRRALGRDAQSPWNADITTRLEKMRRP